MPDDTPTTDHGSAARPDPPASGRARLLTALRGGSRGQLVVAVILAVLGFAAAVQVHAVRAGADFGGARRGDLITLLDSLAVAQTRAQQDIAHLQRTRNALRTHTTRRDTALSEARSELNTLSVLAGTAPAAGPGITVTIHDPDRAVGSSTLLNALEELRDAGAEAIQINDSVRVVAQTALVDKATGLSVGGTLLHPPYVVDAIGSPRTLSTAVVFPGGLVDEVQALGGRVSVTRHRHLVIAALYHPHAAEYAHAGSASP